LSTNRQDICIRKYWDITLQDSTATDVRNFVTGIDRRLRHSVTEQAMSDVPVGTLLSGGIDSSIIATLLTKVRNTRVKTFSMEYDLNNKVNPWNTDRHFSHLMATHLNSNHHDYVFTADEYHESFASATRTVEKPIDMTTPSLYLLYRNIHSNAKVILTGEGADELFAGYFFFLKNIFTDGCHGFPWAPYYDLIHGLLHFNSGRHDVCTQAINEIYKYIFCKMETTDVLNKVLYMFVKLYLVEMLERQDKTSMAWGIEARVPFLDHHFVEYVMNIPSKYKFKDGNAEKYILKRFSEGLLPSEIVMRKKRPLPFPVDPVTLLMQRKKAISLLKCSDSLVSNIFDPKKTIKFLNGEGEYRQVDSLAKFRTSYVIYALQIWCDVFRF
jgi:asparagine synthase (glutamine-hydrolysing)